jgi:putative colanic acid biosynthesis UDP-glucose lipid carrier transferase
MSAQGRLESASTPDRRAEPVSRPAPRDALRSGSSVVRFGGTEPVWLTLLLRIDLPIIVFTLFACLVAYEEPVTMDYSALALVALIVAGQAITPPDLRKTLTYGTRPPLLTARLLLEWGAVVGVLLMLGFALKVSEIYSRRVLLTWFAITPIALIGVQAIQSELARRLGDKGLLMPRYVIVGVNQVGLELARRLRPQSFLGFFDFRGAERVTEAPSAAPLAGHCAALGEFVRRHGVNAVYIALPIANTQRIKQLLDDLRDTTASVYFIPDVFAFDLIQARIVDLNGMPALAVCDTPLHGVNAFAKRTTDVVLAASALLLGAPLLLAIAAAIKLTSRGPVMFRQRRYGLRGEEIVIFKFRTMSVCEDGAELRQASRADSRVTRVGRFLRRTSLDELPQLLNVLGGSMSLVGPRPHAVAHNELYRKVIIGYMIRHKVRPGITGWAQVNGLRGETDTVDKMERRVYYDLDYLNNWSVLLDLRILFRTIQIVLRDRNAY